MNTTTPMGMLQQPRPFFMIFFVELWERFGYYGVQGVLAVFFVKQLGFSQEQAFVTFGAFAALVYGLISIGGYVGDHLLGTKRTIVLGALVLAIGYFMTGMSLLKPDLIFIALGTIAVGNGLFKANPASLLSKCYPPKDPRLDGAFTLFYMSINIGSLIALSLRHGRGLRGAGARVLGVRQVAGHGGHQGTPSGGRFPRFVLQRPSEGERRGAGGLHAGVRPQTRQIGHVSDDRSLHIRGEKRETNLFHVITQRYESIGCNREAVR